MPRLPRALFAAAYDRVLAGSERAGLACLRRRLLSSARHAGDVLEIGAGTGLNARHYSRDQASQRLVLTEPDRAMARRLRRRVAGERPDALVVRADAQALPFAVGSFDAVVSTLVLCTVADPARALGEARRVLRAGGRLLLLEHVRSEEPRLARWQDRLVGLQRLVGLGCECNRPTAALVEDAGFRFEEIEHVDLPRVYAIVRPAFLGVARAA